jgi:hypothetical protein
MAIMSSSTTLARPLKRHAATSASSGKITCGSHLHHTATMCLCVFVGSVFCVRSNPMKSRNSSLVHSFSRASVFRRNLCRRCISRTGEDVIYLDMGLLPYCTTCTSVSIIVFLSVYALLCSSSFLDL